MCCCQLVDLAHPTPLAGLASTPATSDPDHDFPKLSVLLQVTMDLPHLVKLEDAVDDRPECAALEAFEHELHRRLTASLVATRQPNVVRLYGGNFGDHLKHGKRSDLVAEQAVNVDDAAGS